MLSVELWWMHDRDYEQGHNSGRVTPEVHTVEGPERSGAKP